MAITVEKLEERWSSTTIQATLSLTPQPSSAGWGSSSQTVNLPLLNLGWSFTLSLTPKPNPHLDGYDHYDQRQYYGYYNQQQYYGQLRPCTWIPAMFLFRRNSSTIPWGNTSMQAQLSLATEQNNDRGVSSEGCTPQNNAENNATPLGIIEVVLANTPSAEVPITTSCTLSSSQATKVRLTVTISECPFANGLFQGISSQVNEADGHAWLVKQSGDRVLNRSLATGKLFDVKFLTRSTRSTTGKLHQTHVSLSVLKGHVNFSLAELREGWTGALATLNCSENTDAKHVEEISCPNDYDYELDSDFEDEPDEPSFPVELCLPSPSNGCTPEGQQSQASNERSRGPFPSLGLDGIGHQVSFDDLPEEVVRGSEERPHPLAAAPDCERAISLKFVAHRTWYAFLWYCYTGHLEFGKLKSQLEPGTRRLRITHLEDGPPPCSPKSMYRLADLVDDQDLKAKALNAIRERMTETNILDEFFSVFTSKYPDVRNVQLGVLMRHWRSPEVKKTFVRTMSKFGSMSHAESSLTAFYERLATTCTRA